MPIALPLLSALSLSAALPAGASQAASVPPPRPAEPRIPAARIAVQRRILIRVARVSSPRMPIAAAAPLPPISWVERQGERCLPLEAVAGAAITRPDGVDLVLAGGKRMRAKLGAQCPALGFYQGFSVTRTGDGRLCAGRDTIRSRSGSLCRIEGFRSLVPAQ